MPQNWPKMRMWFSMKKPGCRAEVSILILSPPHKLLIRLMDGGTTRTGRLNDFQNMAGWKMNAIRRLSEDRGPRIVSRQPSSSKFRRQSVETARHWVHTKHWWKYSPPFLLFLLLLLVRNFPESRNSTLLDPVAEVIFISLFFVISNQHCSCQPALTYPGAKASKRLDCRGDERVWGANRGEERDTYFLKISLSAVTFVCSGGEGGDKANCCCVFMAQWLLLDRGPLWQPPRCHWQHSSR